MTIRQMVAEIVAINISPYEYLKRKNYSEDEIRTILVEMYERYEGLI